MQWDLDQLRLFVSVAEHRSFSAVARDQLEFALAELSTHENQRVTKALEDNIQAALNGTKAPDRALKDAQAEAERVLKGYR